MRNLAALFLSAMLVWAAPLAGLAIAGRPVGERLGFPPRTHLVLHPGFDWRVFAVYCAPFAAALVLYAWALVRARPLETERREARFPAWGWLGIGLLAASWLLAWREGVVPPEWRRDVFTPLWLGYILLMNGLAFGREGRSLLTHRTRWFVRLFPLSAAFWWLFEYLNQFVADWYYTGVEAESDWEYFARATLPFSTVLPAVASTWAWLRGFRRIEGMNLPPVRGHRNWAWAALVAGIAPLVGIGLWPEILFPLLWLAPLLVLAGLQHLLARESAFAPLERGDWRPVLQPALAALICGLLWELWNFGSVAQWHYSIPYVQRFPIFEMPLLGYAGYLPFGIECCLVMDLLARLVDRRSVWPLFAPHEAARPN